MTERGCQHQAERETHGRSEPLLVPVVSGRPAAGRLQAKRLRQGDPAVHGAAAAGLRAGGHQGRGKGEKLAALKPIPSRSEAGRSESWEDKLCSRPLHLGIRRSRQRHGLLELCSENYGVILYRPLPCL